MDQLAPQRHPLNTSRYQAVVSNLQSLTILVSSRIVS